MLSAATLLGHIIGDYRLKQILGKGATSVVFLGEKITSSQEFVAVKVLLPPASFSADAVARARKRFVREILTLRERLHHPSILPILASGEDLFTGCAYLIIPYISSGNLADHLTGEDLPLSKVSYYVTQIAEALDYAHSQHVIHRDLKPENILIDEDDHVYLADFGIAKLFDNTLTSISDPGQAIGTPGYMAPEQVWGTEVSHATDVYGLAALTYTLLTKRLPFPSASMAQMLLHVVIMPPTPPRTFRSDLPEPAEAVLLRALNKEPANRFATACEFAQALAQGFEGLWPQNFHSQINASAQEESMKSLLPTDSLPQIEDKIDSPSERMDSLLQIEDKTDSPSERQSTAIAVTSLPKPTALDRLHLTVAAALDRLHLTATTALDRLHLMITTAPALLATDKRRDKNLVRLSRQSVLIGLIGLLIINVIGLWHLPGTSSSTHPSHLANQKGTSVIVSQQKNGPSGTADLMWNRHNKTLTVKTTVSGLRSGHHDMHIHAGTCSDRGKLLYKLDIHVDQDGDATVTSPLGSAKDGIPQTGWVIVIHGGHNQQDIILCSPVVNEKNETSVFVTLNVYHQ